MNKDAQSDRPFDVCFNRSIRILSTPGREISGTNLSRNYMNEQIEAPDL